MLEEIPDAELSVDLASQTLSLLDGRQVTFPIDPFNKTCLLNGVDELGYIMGFEKQIAEFEARVRSEEHTSELQSRLHLVCRLLLEKKKKTTKQQSNYNSRSNSATSL